MTGARNIVLMGFMGTGKTSVGKRLAERLGLSFVDMDDVIEEEEGKAISRIFAEDGEARFRECERRLVERLAARPDTVIATGGGVVLNPRNVEDYTRSGLVVCLSATPEVILGRVAQETHRPLLAGDGKRERILGLLESRQALYDAIPCRVDTSRMSIDAVVERILSLYRSLPPG
ncbi:shikimate kinase [Verrucomicrobiota bacterium]